MARRFLIFFLFTLVAAGMAYVPLKDLLSNPVRSDYYSHILLIPLVSGFLAYQKRREIFAAVEYSLKKGSIFLLSGIILYLAGSMWQHRLNINDYASVITLSAVVFWVGGFFATYGRTAFRLARFPLLFLVFMIPIPIFLMDRIIYILQAGSAEVTEFLFSLVGIPAFRSGFYFTLPEVTIEVAKECSGIRSSLGLLITVVLAAHFFLVTNWKRGFLILTVLPITILKNGIRILTLTLLAIYVDMGFLTGGFLHKSGGFLFFLPALGLIGILLYFLRKTEDEKLR
jgi:exosortase